MKKRSIDEKKLVQGILSGNRKSLLAFYHTYKPSLFSYIKKKVNDFKDVEEIMQDTLLATIEGMRDFAFKSSLFTYICAIANHKVVDYYRKKKIKSVFFSTLSGFEPMLSAVFGPEEILDEELLKEKLKVTFGKLAPRYRQILTLKYIYGYSVEEIARKLSITFKSAESQLFRARKAFALAYQT